MLQLNQKIDYAKLLYMLLQFNILNSLVYCNKEQNTNTNINSYSNLLTDNMIIHKSQLEPLYIYIIAGTGSGVVLIVVIIIIVCCCCCRKKDDETQEGNVVLKDNTKTYQAGQGNFAIYKQNPQGSMSPNNKNNVVPNNKLSGISSYSNNGKEYY